MLFEVDGGIISAEPCEPSFCHPMTPGRYRRTSDGGAVVACPGCGKYFHLTPEVHPVGNGHVRMVECPRCHWMGDLYLLAVGQS